MFRKTVAVLGSGNGGQAIAAVLALAGHRVHIYGRRGFQQNLLPIRDRGGIELSGVAGSGLARIARATDSIGAALDGAQLVVVATQATAHEELAQLCAPHVSDGQTILIVQGGAASLIFANVIRNTNRACQIAIGETATLPYTCRLAGPGRVHISRVSRRHLFAAFPGRASQSLSERLRTFFQFLVPATHVFETALYNPNTLLHPAGTLLNLGRIEHTKGEFYIYQEGFTPSIWTLIHAVDAEKMALLRALGLSAIPYLDEFDWRNDDTFDQFASLGIKGPSGPKDRYITEDVPTGLVFFSSLGQALGVPTPVCDSLITICSAINGTDYRATGRTLRRLGLMDVSAPDITRYLMEDCASPASTAPHHQRTHTASGLPTSTGCVSQNRNR